jgi:hypothetical protein
LHFTNEINQLCDVDDKCNEDDGSSQVFDDVLDRDNEDIAAAMD